MTINMPDLPAVRTSSDRNKKQTCDKNDGFFSGMVCEVGKTSIISQFAIGGVTGWCTGFLFIKAGRWIAIALAGSIFAFQLAHHQNYMKINWNKIDKDVDGAKRTWNKETQEGFASSFLKRNAFLITGFAGGLLVGLFST